MKQIKGGGITRFKAHLAGVQKSIDEMKSKKRKVEDEYEDGNPCDEFTDLLHTEVIETPRTSTSQKGKCHIGSYFMPRTTPDAQPILKSVMQSKEVIEKCDLAIAKWMIDTSVSFIYVMTLFIMDSRWDLQLKINLHAVGYWLNPHCFFNFTTSGLLDVFEKHAHGDPDLLDKLTCEMRIYKDVELDFGRPTSIREQSKISCNVVDQWWETYGCRTPNLQRLAVRVEHIHTNKRNRLEHQKLNDVVFVHYHLRLQQRSHLKHQNYDSINLEIFEDRSHFILEESPPFLTVEEIKALRNDLANISIQPSLDDNDQLNLEDGDDAQLNPMKNVNLEEDNVGQASGSNDEEIEPRYETTLTH
ncbi:hypothetical protein Lal_00022723, partial [Lupinus albus]